MRTICGAFDPVKLALLWGEVQYFHPEPVPLWNEAFDTALLELAQQPLRAVVERLLQTLGDPVVGIETTMRREPPRVSVQLPQVRATTTDGFPIVAIPDPAALETREGQQALASTLASIQRSDAAIIDLSTERPLTVSERRCMVHLFAVFGQPALEERVYHGFPGQAELSTGEFHTGWITRDATVRGRFPRTAFLLSVHSVVPPLAIALQQLGRGALFLVGEGNGGPSTTECEPFQRFDCGDGVIARLRTGAVVPPVWNGCFRNREAAEAAAFTWLREPTPIVVPVRQKTPSVLYPTESYRVAAVQLFNTIRRFHPDRERLRSGWDAAFRRLWPEFFAVSEPKAFSTLVRRFLTATGDGHAVVKSRYDAELFGSLPPPLRVREIEGQPTVVRVAHPIAQEAGVRRGDVIVAVDGEPAERRLERLRRYLAASTPQAHRLYALNRLLNGSEGSVARLIVRGDSGKDRTVAVPRMAALLGGTRLSERDGEAVRQFGQETVYFDLDRLRPDEADTALERSLRARTLILDLRGYVHETAWPLAPRLTAKDAPIGARFLRPLVAPPSLLPDIDERQLVEAFVQRLPKDDGRARFRGRLIVLVDERTQSQAEHTALFLEACGARFVGTPTAGAVGDVTSIALPHGIFARFSGQSVLHADGRVVQRVGIQPHVVVRPTLSGVRRGRDEVLEAALGRFPR